MKSTIARLRVCLLMFTSVCLFSACMHMPAPGADSVGTAKNVILLYADGTASTQWELGRLASRELRNAPFLTTDVVMREGALGLMSNRPLGVLVTDSAAAATAMSIGQRTANGMIGMLPDGTRVETLLQAARAAGKRIGLVSTAAIHDASPAAFSVHARSRRNAQAIVDQYLALEPEVLFGGGRDFFMPKTQPGGRRDDGKDVIGAFRAKGYDYVTTTDELERTRGARVLGLFADGDMAYEIDRDARQPSTAQMTAAALRVLAGQSPQGFVLFVENENLDSAGHRNDIASLIRDLWAFDAAVKVALDFQREHPDTLILVTGDHETGGLSITNAQANLDAMSAASRFYAAASHFEQVSRITGSLDRAVRELGAKPDAAALDRVLAKYFPGFKMDADLREALLEQRMLERNFGYTTHAPLSRMISRQTGIYWGTTGHTTEPPVVGALGPGSARFRGYMDNTEFAGRVRAAWGATAPSATQ